MDMAMWDWVLALSGSAAASICAPIGDSDPQAIGGHVVAVGNADGIVQIETSGLANPEHCIAVNDDTVFHIASLSKQITAAALAMAILEEKVAPNDPVSKHIPEAEHYGEGLTIAHLLYFTSGLTEGYATRRGDGRSWVTYHYFDVDEAISASLAVQDLRFEPGSRWEYNNINYQLISEIVERAYDKPFSQVVQERIFDPLGMSRSLVHDDTTQIVPGRADGVIARTPETVAQLASAGIDVAADGTAILIRRNAPHYGGSGVLTSIEDWAKWQSEMLTGEKFGKPFWDLMFSTRKFDHPKANDAFGLVHGELNNEPILWFAGSDIDSSSYMLVSSERERWAACFSNNPLFDCQSRARALFGGEE